MVSITALENLDCEMPPEALKRFNAKRGQFQMMPEAAIRALELIKDPACDLSLVAKTIEQDVKLTASIISVANSPLYCPGRPITTVRTAIINVGFHQCQSLIQGLLREKPHAIDGHLAIRWRCNHAALSCNGSHRRQYQRDAQTGVSR